MDAPVVVGDSAVGRSDDLGVIVLEVTSPEIYFVIKFGHTLLSGAICEGVSMPIDPNPNKERTLLTRIYRWALDVSPDVIKRAPRAYLGAISLLLAAGLFCLILIHLDARKVFAQTVQSEQTPSVVESSAQTVSAGTNSVDESVHNQVIRRGSASKPVQIVVTNNAGPTATEKPADKISAELKDDIDGFKWVLTLILSVAGLFAIIQGIATGFSAIRFTQQAEKDLGEIEDTIAKIGTLKKETIEDIGNLKKEIAEKYPDVLEMLAKRRKYAQRLLEDQLRAASPTGSPDEGYNWARRFYTAMPREVRQEILSVERALPYEIAGEEDPPTKYSTQLQRLARFYWSKFLYEDPLGFGCLSDLERAEFLLLRGAEKSELAFSFYNDLGGVYTEFFRVKRKAASRVPADAKEGIIQEAIEDFDDAEDAYLKSRQFNSNQLRAYFNLAIMEAENKTRFREYFPDTVEAKSLNTAVDYIRTGLRIHAATAMKSDAAAEGPAWETRPIPAYTCEAWFNLGCYYARLAGLEPNRREEYIAECLKSLGEAAKIGLVKRVDVDEEFAAITPAGSAGDFYGLTVSSDETTQHALAELKDELSTPKPNRNIEASNS